MNKFKTVSALAAAVLATATLGGCAVAKDTYEEDKDTEINTQIPDIEQPEANTGNDIPVEVPKVLTVSYINVTADGVNIRSCCLTGRT